MAKSRHILPNLFEMVRKPLAPGIQKALVMAFGLMLSTFIMGLRPCHSENARFESHQIMAVFVYNLTNFVTWPDEKFKGPDTPLFIGILGNDPFEGMLEKVVKGETVNGRPIAVQQDSEIHNLSHCHIVVISSSMKMNLPQIFVEAGKYKVLTVGDTEGFAQQGGMVNLISVAGRMRLEVNLRAARKAGLQISSKLLNLATIIDNDGRSQYMLYEFCSSVSQDGVNSY